MHEHWRGMTGCWFLWFLGSVGCSDLPFVILKPLGWRISCHLSFWTCFAGEESQIICHSEAIRLKNLDWDVSAIASTWQRIDASLQESTSPFMRGNPPMRRRNLSPPPLRRGNKGVGHHIQWRKMGTTIANNKVKCPFPQTDIWKKHSNRRCLRDSNKLRNAVIQGGNLNQLTRMP